MDDFPYLYRDSYGEAVRYGMEKQYDASFRENVICARAIEQAIRDHSDEVGGGLAEGCAQSVLARYGFKAGEFRPCQLPAGAQEICLWPLGQ